MYEIIPVLSSSLFAWLNSSRLGALASTATWVDLTRTLAHLPPSRWSPLSSLISVICIDLSRPFNTNKN